MTHALLISGEAGVGKWSLAQTLAASLLCEHPEDACQPCGRCKACAQTEALSHPDLTVIRLGFPLRPTETKTVIPVSDVEEMIDRISLQGFQGDRHAVIIRHAEDMNPAAQNRLLKTLEEPPAGTFFLLTCRNARDLLPTIVSRCRQIALHPWGDREVSAFLEEQGFTGLKAEEAVREAGGSFGQALAIMKDEEFWKFREEVQKDFLEISKRSDILAVSTRWKDRREEAERLFSVLDRLIGAMMRRSLFGTEEGTAGLPEAWRKYAEGAEPADYVRLQDAVSLARRRVASSVSFQVVLEQLILTLMEEVKV